MHICIFRTVHTCLYVITMVNHKKLTNFNISVRFFTEQVLQKACVGG